MHFRRCAVLFGLVAAVGCSEKPAEDPVGNLSPHVRITGGPIEGTRDSYRSRIYWSGWDDDGTIARYEYAVDPPSAFTAAEIDAPEAAPGLTIKVIPGPAVNRDIVRVTKFVDDVPYSFDFVQTVETDRIFSLTASVPETISVAGQQVPSGSSYDYHAVYVRAQDNEGAYSGVDRLAFNAYSYAPSAHILFPYMGSRQYLITGGRIRISWYGFDPDPPGGVAMLPGFYWKLVDLKSLTPPLSIFRDLDLRDVMFNRTRDVPWTYQSADTTTILLFVEPSEYVFAVRAVDEAGAVEPFLDINRGDEEPGNALPFLVTEQGGVPVVTLVEPTLGTYEFRGRGGSNIPKTEVPTGVPLRFRWSASADLYGGKIEATSYGLDIADLEAEGPGSGWSPWASSIFTTSSPIVFKDEGYHIFYVRVRDTAGTVQIVSLGITAFDISLDRPLLLVDDFRSPLSFLSDGKHDAFWETLVRDSGRFAPEDQVRDRMWFDAGGDRDADYFYNAPPPLSLMGRYALTIWIVHGQGYCGRTALLQAAVETPALRAYVAAGGELWIVGFMTFSSMVLGPTPCLGKGAGNTAYPFATPPGSFPYDVLRIASGRVDDDKADRWENTMAGVEGWPGPDPFPDMEVDGKKFFSGYWEERALAHCDAVIDPIELTGDHPHPGDLDSLYAYVAANEVRPLHGYDLKVSPYRDALCATRWHDPDPAALDGRAMWFGFPLYFMKTEQAQQTFNRAIDWFREEVPPPAVSSRR